MFLRFPWKKNLMRIPDAIMAKLDNMGRDVVVVCSRYIREADIRTGLFDHLDISVQEGGIEFENQVVPAHNVGRYSRYNVQGREIKRSDLPKIQKTYSWDVPNYGDWSKGSHVVSRTREVYARDYLPPKELCIEITLGEVVTIEGDREYLFFFRVGEVLNSEADYFYDELLFALNFLQENIGLCDVAESTTSYDDYLRTTYVGWEILPPGEYDATLRRILEICGRVSPQARDRINERAQLLHSMNPRNYIVGRSGFRRYFGAQFSDNLVVFENIEYGNAIYIMYDNWDELSRQSRSEILRSGRGDYERIVHRQGWETRLRRLIQESLAG